MKSYIKFSPFLCLSVTLAPIYSMEPERVDSAHDVQFVCDDGTNISTSRSLWEYFFSKVPLNNTIDPKTAQLIVNIITLASTPEHNIDTHCTANGLLAQKLSEDPTINVLNFFESYCSLKPNIQHPLTHLVAWHAARNIYSQQGIAAITDVFNILRRVSGTYCPLACMYFYFQMHECERMGLEEFIINNFPIEYLDIFFENNPQYELANTEGEIVETFTRAHQASDGELQQIMPELIVNLIAQDDPLLLRYASILQQRKGIAIHHKRPADIYREFEAYLRNHSVMATSTMLSAYNLNANHIFKVHDWDPDNVRRTIEATTPLLIAITRGLPQLVSILLRAGAKPGMKIMLPDGKIITPRRLARSFIDPKFNESVSARPVSLDSEVWYTGSDDDNINAQCTIIELLTEGAKKQSAPQLLVTSTDESLTPSIPSASSTSVVAQDPHHLSLPEEAPASPRKVYKRRNAITNTFDITSEQATSNTESNGGPADEVSQDYPTPLAPTMDHVVDDFGFGCGCGIGKKTKKNDEKCVLL